MKNKNNTFIYTWNELQSKKGANEIASFIFYRPMNTDYSENISVIRFFADGCTGQNMNSIIISMAAFWLQTKAPIKIKEIQFCFSMPGHSFMAPNHVFSGIENVIKKKSVIADATEYLEILRKFGIVLKIGEGDVNVYDWKTSVNDIVKSPGAWHFKFGEMKRFILSKKPFLNKVLIRGEALYKLDYGAFRSIIKRNKNLNQIKPTKTKLGVLPNLNFKK